MIVLRGLRAAAIVGAAFAMLAATAPVAGAGAAATPSAATPSPATPSPATPPAASTPAWAAAVARERADKVAYFRDNPWSPLRAFARYDFAPIEDGKPEPTAVAGSAPDVAIRLDAPGIASRQLQIAVQPPPGADRPYRFRLDRLAAGPAITIGGKPWPDAASPVAGGSSTRTIVDEETVVTIGPFALRPYVQADAGILIEFDSRRTAGDAFVAPAFYDADPAWSFEAPLQRYPNPEKRSLLTSLGRRKEYLAVGWFDLRGPDGSPLKVQVYEPRFVANGADHLSILFTDATTGKETYGAGRYLDLAPPRDGLYRVDFNGAYNPLCAYTHVYNCPIPPRENALPLAVRAGEKNWPGHVSH